MRDYAVLYEESKVHVCKCMPYFKACTYIIINVLLNAHDNSQIIETILSSHTIHNKPLIVPLFHVNGHTQNPNNSTRYGNGKKHQYSSKNTNLPYQAKQLSKSHKVRISSLMCSYRCTGLGNLSYNHTQLLMLITLIVEKTQT